MRRSVSAASLSITHGAPEGRVPIRTFDFSSRQSWTTMRQLSMILLPSFAASSAGRGRAVKAVATSSVTSMSGFPSRSSSSMLGMISRLGTGRVWSEMMITQFFFPRASSLRRGLSIGLSIARRTISLPLPLERSLSILEVRTLALPSLNSMYVFP